MPEDFRYATGLPSMLTRISSPTVSTTKAYDLALGKLFAEVVENADMRPWDGVRAAGGTWLHGVRFAILPQVMPNFLSYLLLRFEINVR